MVVGSADISGTKTGLILLAADAFGVAPEAVNVIAADTDTSPYAGASGGSQITIGAGCGRQRGRRCSAAGAGYRRRAPGGSAGGFGDLRRSRGGARCARPWAQAQKTPPTGRAGGITNRSTGVVEQRQRRRDRVSSPTWLGRVDEETGVVQVLDYVAVQDVGRAINPAGIEDQI